MYPGRKMYRYYPVVRDPEMVGAINILGKSIGKIGVCIGFLSAGGYFLYRKVNDLSKEIKKMKEETGK